MKQWMKRWVTLCVTASLAALTACGGGDQDPDIVTKARLTPELSTLAEAIDAAGLAATLQAPGPTTVFAPTNAAFADVLAELKLTKEQLFANKPLLTSVLTYHVVAGKVNASAVPLGRPVTSAQKGYFKAESVSGQLQITDARNRVSRVTAADVPVSNGVVHLVDKVLLPGDKTVVGTAVGFNTGTPPQFTLLVEALIAANLVDTLNGPGPFTVFAPTDAAFAALLTELGITKEALFADKALLTKVLTYHVVPGLVLKAQVPVGSPIATVQTGTFAVNASLAITDQRARVARITGTDVLANNGVIHVIDKVLLPAP